MTTTNTQQRKPHNLRVDKQPKDHNKPVSALSFAQKTPEQIDRFNKRMRWRMRPKAYFDLYEAIIKHQVKCFDDLATINPSRARDFIFGHFIDLLTFNNIVGACWRISTDRRAADAFRVQFVASRIRNSYFDMSGACVGLVGSW